MFKSRAKRWTFRFLKIGFWTVFGLIVTVSGLAITIWTWPSVILNDRSVELAHRYLSRHGVAVQWESFHVRAFSRAFLIKGIEIEAKKVCYANPAAGIQGCADAFGTSAVVSLRGKPSYHLGPLSLLGGHFQYHPPPESPSAPAPSSAPSGGIWPTPPSIFHHISFETVRIEVSQFEFIQGGIAVRGKTELDGTSRDGKSDWKLALASTLKNGRDVYSAEGDVSLASLGDVWFGPYRANANLSMRLPERRTASLVLRGEPEGSRALRCRVQAAFRDRRRSVRADASGKWDPEGAEAVVTATALRWVPEIPNIAIRECRLGWKVLKGDGKELSVDCPGILTTHFARFHGTIYENAVDRIAVLFTSRLKLSERNGKPGEVSGSLKLGVDPVFRQIREGSAALSTDVSGSLSDFPKQLKLDTRFMVDIPHFERLVTLAQSYPWAIPEPFNALHGSVTFRAGVQDELMHHGGQVPLEFVTRLSSEQQKLNLDGKGQLTLRPLAAGFGGHLDFKLNLSDVQLLLPHLDLEAPPQLVPDARIKKQIREVAAAASSVKSPLTYHVEIVSPGENPVKIISNLARAPVPISLSLQVSDQKPLHGSIRILEFPVQLFHRTATIEHIDLKMASDSKHSEVNGVIQVVYTDYTIRILILGLLDNPQIEFTSDPPLPQDKVLAVLLFGKQIDELDSSQQASVGNTQAAVADSAISLASMYLLASTPVESVGYDPASHVFQAKVRLANGTSLNVGSDMTQLNQIGIRKQLGNHWTITTYLEHPLDFAAVTVSAFLEWSKGY